jgi:peptidoglycan/LPS O-acetylase OafA/YrhL
MNPMFYGTFAFLGFSSFFIISGLWLIHSMKKDKRERDAAALESRSQSAD